MQESNLSSLEKYEVKKNIQSFYIQHLTEIAKRFDFSRKDIKYLFLITPDKVLDSSDIRFEPLLTSFPHLTDGNGDQILTQFKLLRFSNIGLEPNTEIIDFWNKIYQWNE